MRPAAEGLWKTAAYCQTAYSTWRSVSGTPWLSAYRRKWAEDSRSQSSQSSGSSAIAASRARTSALRLVSWVVRMVPVAYQSRWRRAQKAWKSSGAVAGQAGSRPTSLRDIRGYQR